MGRTVRTVLLTVAAVAVIAIGTGLTFLYSGAYDVAATESHWGITRWALSTLKDRSVSTRADSVIGQRPTDAAALQHGFEHFHAMCVQCHGAPGMDPGETGKGINPTPPRLEEEAHEWSDAELFWITRHGIKLAGMPAFGPTHSDEEIWGIVGFIRELETMTEEEYADRVRALQATAPGDSAGAGGHTHAPGTPPHGH